VTKGQWRKFAKAEKVWAGNRDQLRLYIRTDDSPMTAMMWYEAAHYCNWLSEQEGISKEQWCYEPNDKGEYGPGMKTKAKFWELSGYRLPTEAEWEFACRAGASTSRYYGATETLLSNYAAYYAAYQVNEDYHTHPVASLKPNDFGLFDMQGNANEWVYDGMGGYPASSKDTADAPSTKVISDTHGRVLRGGSFSSPALLVRSAVRVSFVPTLRNGFHGFRPCRTYNLYP
jgi:formylglycine-generating enzyme required for sulfatase activity